VQQLFAAVQKEMGGEKLFEALQKFLKEYPGPLQDVTELLRIKEFSIFRDAIFYEPVADIPPSAAAKDETRPFYLTDLLTTYGVRDTIEPWLFSDSIAGVLGLKRAQPGDIKERKALMQTVLKNFSPRLAWPKDWNERFKPLCGKELQSLPKDIESTLNKQFAPKVFSVISYGVAEKMVQRLFAIVQREEQRGDGDTRFYDVTIKKLYWL